MIQVESQVFLYLVKEGSKIKEVIIFFKEVAQLISVGAQTHYMIGGWGSAQYK